MLREMMRLLLVVICLLYSSVSHAQLPQISSGLNYLTSAQNADGTWQTGTAQVETTAATVSVLETLKLLNQTAGTPYTTGIAWLQAQAPLSVAYIAERIHALGLTNVSTLTPSVDGTKGGWGGDSGYETNLLDTSLALQALQAANYSDTTIINPALAFLTTTQNPDGGWGFYAGDESNVFSTAVVSATLQQFPQMTTVATAVGKATAFLLAHQNADGGFGSSPSTVYETVLAYAALAAVSSDATVLSNAVTYLTVNQAVNGSWNDDPYSTALALKALYLSENRPAPPPAPPAAGKLSGTVVDAITLQRVAGVSVSLAGNSLIAATSDSLGNFTLADVPPGSQTLNLAKTGFAPTTVTATAQADVTVNLGTIPLTSAYTTGTIAGIITDTAGKPLADVAITVSGAWNGSATTGADGSYAIAYVTPGAVTITAIKAGYQTVTTLGTVYARTTLSFSPRLGTTSSTATTGTLVGRVVDAWAGVPIDHLPGEEGVTVKLSGGIIAYPDPNNRGQFEIQGLAPNTYQVIVGMNGFTTRTFRVVVMPGVTTDLGTIRLEMTISKMALTGKITDATSGAPIPGAEVTIVDNNLTGRADFAGTYAIADIPTGVEYTVKVSAAGYVGKTYIISSSPWTQTMDIKLMPRETKGTLTGTVVDASTNQPLEGVTLTLVSDPAVSATTDAGGAFTFAAVPKGVQQVTLALGGYSGRTLTTAITAGTVNDVGSIPLSVTSLNASIRGRVWDGYANAPFAGVEVMANGTTTLQAFTEADGSYAFDNVEPGTVTLTVTASTKTGYYPASLTGTLEPNGILVFSPTLTTVPPSVVDVAVQTDKPSYAKSDPVNISVNLRNTESTDYASSLRVRVFDPASVSVYDTTSDLNLAADGMLEQNSSFTLPLSAPGGTYKVLVDLYDTNGMLLGTGTKSFGVATSRITVTPEIPAVLTSGDNTVTFNLVNVGTIAVSNGTLAVILKDPDGQDVSIANQSFTLGTGESTTLTYTVSIPSPKFGNYTLTYAESDETVAGSGTDLPLLNGLVITPLFDSNSHRIRQTAGLSVTLTNAGRFNLDPTGAGLPVTVSVPDAGYEETKVLAPVPAVGNASGSTLMFNFTLPETLKAGLHKGTITVTLPSGSTQTQTAQLAILESSLALTPIQSSYMAGDTITPQIANSGGVDTQVQYHLGFYDAKSALIAESTGTGTAAAGASLAPSLGIPAGAVDGQYNVVVQFKNMTTTKEDIIPNPITVSGVKGALQVQTDKENYLLSENITAGSTTTNTGTVPVANGNLHLQVSTAAGNQKQKTWTSQYDWQQGVRNGVDTYGVNDWIIPDDDFDGAAIDATKWTITGTVSVQSGAALVDSSSVQSSLTSKWQLEGDFDIQVDFSNNNSVGNQGAELGISGNSYWIFVKNTQSEGYLSAIQLNGSTVVSGGYGGYSQSGRFRVTRSGSIINTFIWNGSGWTQLVNYSNSKLSESGRIVLWLWRGSGYYGTNTKFDNFKVNTGRIKTENQAMDSVRLLPLNDNFDDGIINEDRWNIVKPNYTNISELNGRLFLESTVANQNIYASARHRAEITGDATAQVDFGLDNWASQNMEKFGILFTINSAYYAVERIYDTHWSGNNYASDFNGPPFVPFFQTTDVTGTLRLGRSAGTMTSSYLASGGWQSLQQQYNVTGAGTFQLGLWNDPGYPNPTTKVSCNKFKITGAGNYASYGITTERFDSGVINRWGVLTWTSTEPSGTSLKFRTRTAATEADLANATWSDYLTVSGSAITSPPGRWIEIDATFSTTDTNITPLLHDLTVTYGNDPGDVLWETDVPVNLDQGVATDLNSVVGILGTGGKYYLQGTLTSSTGQTVATAEYPFYVEQGNIHLAFSADRKTYKPGETVTITGEVANLSSVDAAGLALLIKGTGASGGTLYTETFDLPVSGNHPFSFTTVAGADGTYGLAGTVSQNGTVLAEIGDQYQVASPAVTATLTGPDMAGDAPFNLSIAITNSGVIDASLQINNSFGSAPETIAIPAGQTIIRQYQQQISADTTYTFNLTGDLVQALTKTVAYMAPPLGTNILSFAATVSVDKVSYNSNEQVTIGSTVTNQSASVTAENLSALVTVASSRGQVLYSNSTLIQTLSQGQTVALNNYWNTGTFAPGTYLVSLNVVDTTGTVIATASRELAINSSSNPTTLLKGQISLDKQSILTGEPVVVSYSITNAGNTDLANVAILVQTINLVDQLVYNTSIDQTTLVMGASHSNSGQIDTQGFSAKDYLVVLRASIDGVEETIASTYFRVEGAPSAPALAGPANGSDVETFTPSLTVSNAADPNDDKLTYEFEIYGDSGLTDLIASGEVQETAGTTAWAIPMPLVENQTYYWRTRAFDGKLYGPWMTPATFRVNTVDDPPGAPTIASPADGTTVAMLAPALTVNNASDPDSTNLTYNFVIALDPDFTQVVSLITGIAGGQEATSWTVPVDLQENGWYYWRAQADDWLMEGPWSTASRFLVNTTNDPPSAPVVTAPANGSTVAALATDVVVANGIDPDSSSLLYYFEADMVPTFDSPGIIRSGGMTEGSGVTLWQLGGLLDNTRYYLRTKASDGLADSPWSATTTFVANTANDPPTTPTLANPSSGAGVSVFSPALSVQNATDPDDDLLTYEFEVSAESSMANPIAQMSGIVETPAMTSWTISAVLTENQTYYWRARAYDGALTSAWMPIASFMINTANDAPGPAAIISPTDGSSVGTLTPTLEVANAVDPDSDSLFYEFELYAGTTLVTSTSGIPGNSSGTISWTLATPLADNTVYQWRARAFDGDRYGQWTNMTTFTTHIPVTSIRAEIEFEPRTLNNWSQGRWVKVEIELPRGYPAADIDISSIRLEGTVPAEALPYCINQHEDGDELTVKFRRSDVIAVLPAGEHVPVHVTGNVGSAQFEGVDIIRVIK